MSDKPLVNCPVCGTANPDGEPCRRERFHDMGKMKIEQIPDVVYPEEVKDGPK